MYKGGNYLELLVIVLNKTELLTELLDGFIEKGISGATVIDSSGIGHLVADHIPFFSQFIDFGSEDKNHSKTIFMVVSCLEERNLAVKNVEEVLGDITKPDSAFLFSVPVNFVKGISSDKCGVCK